MINDYNEMLDDGQAKTRKYERPAVRMEDEHFRINFDSVVVLDLCCL